MEGQTKERSLRENIDKLLEAIQVDLDAVEKKALGINYLLLGPEEKEAQGETGRKPPSGWLNQIVEKLVRYGNRLKEIQRIQTRGERMIGEYPELKKLGEKLSHE